MSLVSPPYRTAWAVNYWAPGFWHDFFRELDAAVRATGPVTATSWWRSPTHNAEVGGNRDSQHLIGTAVDLVTEEPDQLARELARFGWITVNEGDHLHVQAWPAGVARAVGLLDALGL